MRALLIGAVEGTRVAMETIAAAPGWELAGLLTLSPALKQCHSDFVDLGADANRLGAELVLADNSNDPQIIAAIEKIAPDISFVIGWSQLCSAALIEAGGGRMVGYHPSALPRLRGRAAIPWTILMSEAITASTLFWVTSAVDAGSILAQRFFHVVPDETASSLYAKHMHALVLALNDLLPRLLAGDPAGEPQNPQLATWGARRTPEDGRIDWHRSAAAIDRLVRAVGRPYPGAFTFAGPDRVVIWSTSLPGDGRRFHASPGQIVAQDKQGFTVSCGDGETLRVVEHESSLGSRPRPHTMFRSPAA
jgi:methionyl-tRNA formyltransferase